MLNIVNNYIVLVNLFKIFRQYVLVTVHGEKGYITFLLSAAFFLTMSYSVRQVENA